jgi:hypothetical protein
MKEREKMQGIITASYIMYLANALLPCEEQSKTTTIRLMQVLREKTCKQEYYKYVELSNLAWAKTVNKFKNDNMHIVISQAVETLWFNNLDVMLSMFGVHSTDIVLRFVMKQTQDNVDSVFIKESNLVIDELTKNTDKVIYDYQKENK